MVAIQQEPASNPSAPTKVPLLVILGPTASGKSALAMELAKRLKGEIISADSRAVYKGMDIGTAKPTLAEQAEVPHHLIDIVAPDQLFTVADYKKLAQQAITDIAQRGKMPIMVGGSGLYIDSVLFDYSFRAPPDPKLRAQLRTQSIEELQALILERQLEMPDNSRNPVHLIRVIEAGGREHEKASLRRRTVVVGLRVERSILKARLEQRVNNMVEAGLVDEVKRLANVYGWGRSAMRAPGYVAMREYIEGHASLDEAKARFVQNDMQLAKRQMTWFRRNNSIHWLDYPSKYVDSTTQLVNTLLR